MEPKFSIVLTESELNILMDAISKEPWGKVYRIAAAIMSQYSEQKNPPMPPATPPPPPEYEQEKPEEPKAKGKK